MRLPSIVRAAGAVALLASAAPAVGQSDGAAPARLVVTAEGEVAATPDMATLRLGVVREDPAADAAVAALSEGSAALLERLAAAGVAERDVQTSTLSLEPLRRRAEPGRESAPEIVGYRAATTVTARLRDLDAVGPILDAVVGGGANEFDGLTFGLSDPEPLLDEARRAAVAEAGRRAALYADAAGVTLGPLLRLEEGGRGPRPPVMRAEAAMADGVAIAPGELTVSAQVRMVWTIAAE